MIGRAIFLALVGVSAAARAGEIAERISNAPTFSLHSTRPPLGLSVCVADAYTGVAQAAVIPDEGGRLLVTGTGSASVQAVIELNPQAGGGTAVIGHIRARNWDARVQRKVEACL